VNAEDLQAHWALILACATGIVLLLLAAWHVFRNSARGQLRRMRRSLERERATLCKATAVVRKAERQKSRLSQHAERVKPRLLNEASEALEDARALAKIAGDRVLVAENHLRRVILEEFPPAQHERLRSLYLPDGAADKRPFTF
jgi:hypothetical protein